MRERRAGELVRIINHCEIGDDDRRCQNIPFQNAHTSRRNGDLLAFCQELADVVTTSADLLKQGLGVFWEIVAKAVPIESQFAPNCFHCGDKFVCPHNSPLSLAPVATLAEASKETSPTSPISPDLAISTGSEGDVLGDIGVFPFEKSPTISPADVLVPTGDGDVGDIGDVRLVLKRVIVLRLWCPGLDIP